MIFRPGIMFALFLLPLLACGQQKEYLLSGNVYIKDGPVCRYNIVFKIAGNSINGKSVTVQPDGRELNALINGSINRKRHTLSFIESKLPLTPELDNCMFDVKLSYKIADGNYIFSGTFTGKNSYNDSCDEGTVSMEAKKEASDAFEQVRPKKKPVEQKAEITEVEVEKPMEYGKITASVKKEFEWQTDTCVLEIWDGEVVDGDIVTLQFNRHNVLTGYSLLAERKRIVLPLAGKTNTITVFAENEGKAPPNTSMILLSDGKIQYGVLACIRKGETAEIIIRKK